MNELIVASSWFSRVRGLFFRKKFKGSLLLVPCNDIHTYGLRRDIDVAFLTREGQVITSYVRVKSGKRLRCSNAHAVVERFSRDDTWYRAGSKVTF